MSEIDDIEQNIALTDIKIKELEREIKESKEEFLRNKGKVKKLAPKVKMKDVVKSRDVATKFLKHRRR